MGLLAVVDRIVAQVPVPSGTARDTAAAAPSPFEAGTLYGWATQEIREPTGDATIERGDFAVRLAITVAAAEDPGQPRDRTVSVALEAAAEDIAAWVVANRIGPALDDGTHLWGHLRVARIEPDAIRGDAYRGHFIDLTGWRFIDTEEA